jgi:hypothetical protein
MKSFWLIVPIALVSLLALAQPPGFPSVTTPTAQRNALATVRSQVDWLQNATRTASSYATGSADLLSQRFQAVRGAYAAFKTTLTPQQLDNGANEFAELDAGLNIIEEAFSNYQQDVAAGQSASTALRNLSRALNDASVVWLKELETDARHLQVGR